MSGGPRMSFAAMAQMMSITKTQLIELRNSCLQKGRRTSRDGHEKHKTFSREDLQDAMNNVKLDANDKDILDNLFTMWDKDGDNKVEIIYFLAGVSPLASTMDVETKLLFAFEVFDVNNSGRIKKSDAVKILNGINSTASYFGDSVLNNKAIYVLVDDVYKDQAEIYYEEYTDLFASHPAVVQFINSGGTMKYNP